MPPRLTLTAPKLSRSRDTVAWVTAKPNARSRSVASSWLAIVPPRSRSASVRRRRARVSVIGAASTPARGVHAVLGLAPDCAARAFHDVVADLLAAAGGEAVQEPGVAGSAHQRLIDLIAGEGAPTDLGLFVLAHRHPDVGIDDAGAFDRFGGIGDLADAGRRLLEAIAVGAGDDELGADQRTGLGERPADVVVAVADISDARPFDAAEQLFYG